MTCLHLLGKVSDKSATSQGLPQDVSNLSREVSGKSQTSRENFGEVCVTEFDPYLANYCQFVIRQQTFPRQLVSSIEMKTAQRLASWKTINTTSICTTSTIQHHNCQTAKPFIHTQCEVLGYWSISNVSYWSWLCECIGMADVLKLWMNQDE